jgi:hypothetical protein
MGVVGFERSMAYEFKLVDRADGRRDFAADGLIAIVELARIPALVTIFSAELRYALKMARTAQRIPASGDVRHI